MNSIVSINKEEDISKITKETKYINIPIDIVDNNINNYFIINGVDYSYSESINRKQGFIYADYNMFKQGELLIDSIIKDIPQNLSDIEKVILTASGGPFRGKKKEELLNVTKNEALKHPNWSMGRKISIDSSTLMNKGLEVIGEVKCILE